MTKAEYLKNGAENFGVSEEKYYSDSKHNYVILDGGDINSPLSFGEDDVVVYCSRKEAKYDVHEGDKIITEQKYIDSLK